MHNEQHTADEYQDRFAAEKLIEALDPDRPVEDVIFLGAGASMADKGLGQSQLLAEYFKGHQAQLIRYEREGQKEVVKRRRERYRSMVHFLRSFFGIDVKNDTDPWSKMPTCEEVIGVLDLSMILGEGFDLRGEYELSKLDSIRNNVLLSIIDSITKSLENVPKGGINHKKLAGKIRQPQARGSKIAIVSTNYDILIDNALDPEAQSIDYGIDFCNIPRMRLTPPLTRLYKIHGSLNWLYCTSCKKMRITPGLKAASALVNGPVECKKCGSTATPFLTSPTYFKDLRNIFFQQVWLCAENALKQSKRVFFCGYSFPDADIHIKYLLKRAEVVGKKGPEVFVMNCHQQKTASEALDEYDRYHRFFSNRDRLHYCNLGFKEFCRLYPDSNFFEYALGPLVFEKIGKATKKSKLAGFL